ncbi:MAG: 50S ribosomal protein L25 [Spirochaetia bacterium]|nr:50S ribosomal protein L25 [Spirochaetia bacterium]
MENLALKAEAREKNIKPKALRRKELVPAVIYNHGKADNIQIADEEIRRLFSHGVSESVLIDIEWGGKKETAFIKDYQMHPLNGNITHIDFFRITYGEKIKTRIPIELTGKPVGVREGGVLEMFLHEIEVAILPKNLVPSLKVDISELKIGDAVHVNDVQLPPDSKALIEGNPIICNVAVPAKLKAEESSEETSAEAAKTEEKASE